ncbi:MAG: acyltransferase [Sphingobium sp.]|nr:acyltransferase [Sphingobium sp.]MCP5397834.1 acyltransferase [Sphingomonas sp.]
MDAVTPEHGLLPRRRIKSLEIGRGLAALAVVVFHANTSARFYDGPSVPWLNVTEYGVDFFFLLSGYIIYHAHQGDIGRPGGVGSYLKSRTFRLFPVLWTVVAAVALLRLTIGNTTSFSTLMMSMFPYPSLEPPLPQVVWTLRHEMLFYAAFALLILSARWGYALFALWGLACVAQIIASIAGVPVTGAWSLPLSSYTLDFMIGMAIANFHSRRHFAPSYGPLMLGLALLAGVLAITHIMDFGRDDFWDYVSVRATVWTLVRGLAFGLVVHGLVCAEPLVGERNPFVSLGAASYAIYLIHTPVNSILQRIAVYIPDMLLELGAGHFFLVGGGVLAGYILHYGYERPVGIFLKRKFISPTIHKP